MAQHVLVAEDVRVADGQGLLTELRRAGFEPTVAGWVRFESGRWTLYLGTSIRDRDERLVIRQKLIDGFGRLKEPWFSLIEVSLTDADGPLARELLRLRGRLAGREPGHFQVDELADQPVREVFVYPPVGPMTPPEMLRAFVGKMVGGPATVAYLKSKGEPVPTVTLVYKDGRSERYHPVGLSAWGDGTPLEASSDPVLLVEDVTPNPVNMGLSTHTVPLREVSAVL